MGTMRPPSRGSPPGRRCSAPPDVSLSEEAHGAVVRGRRSNAITTYRKRFLPHVTFTSTLSHSLVVCAYRHEEGEAAGGGGHACVDVRRYGWAVVLQAHEDAVLAHRQQRDGRRGSKRESGIGIGNTRTQQAASEREKAAARRHEQTWSRSSGQLQVQGLYSCTASWQVQPGAWVMKATSIGNLQK